MTVKTLMSVDLIGILKADCSQETRIALHIPSST